MLTGVVAGNSLDAVDKDTALTHPDPKQTYSKGKAKAKVLVEKQGTSNTFQQAHHRRRLGNEHTVTVS
jgi:hypothetical protein